MLRWLRRQWALFCWRLRPTRERWRVTASMERYRGFEIETFDRGGLWGYRLRDALRIKPITSEPIYLSAAQALSKAWEAIDDLTARETNRAWDIVNGKMFLP
jgi:hypothetical protein